MGKYLLILVFLLAGCNNPLDNVKQNKQEIENLKQQINKLQNKVYKIDEIEIKLKNISQNQAVIQKTISNNQVLAKLASLNKEISMLKNKDKLTTFDYIVIHPITLITIKKSNIYSSYKNGKIIKSWPKQTTFTSYKEKDGFVKVTGYFIHKKWVENNKEWWIKKQDATIKRLEK